MLNNTKHWIEKKGRLVKMRTRYKQTTRWPKNGKRRADEIQKAQISADLDKPRIDADKELALREMEQKTQAQASTNATIDPSPLSRDAKSPMLPALVDKKDELDTYLLRFERYAKNAKWRKLRWLSS